MAGQQGSVGMGPHAAAPLIFGEATLEKFSTCQQGLEPTTLGCQSITLFFAHLHSDTN